MSKLALGSMLEHLARIFKTEIVEQKSKEALVVYKVCAPQLCALVEHVTTLARWITDLRRYIEIDNLPTDHRKEAKIRR